jgi:hypothetical protein
MREDQAGQHALLRCQGLRVTKKYVEFADVDLHHRPLAGLVFMMVKQSARPEAIS